MNSPNIFRIATSALGPEDRFTSFLHYLVDSIPSIGQGLVDVICQRAGLDPAIFEMAKDHPEGDAENKPDFMLSCKEFDILCEHKLGSDLGDRQLERYLALPKNRPTYVVLITNRLHTISEEVLQSSHYRRPMDSPVPSFYWEDFYPVIASHNDRLAQDFAKYMRDLGMVPSPLPEDWAQLFTRREVAEQFYEATMDMRSYFSDELGAQCQADPSRLGLQVKYPAKWLHLLYFQTSKTAKPPLVGIEPPYLVVRVIVNEADSEHIEHLLDTTIRSADTLISVRTKNEPAGWGTNLVLRYEYHVSLDSLLTTKTVETRARLLAFGKAVFAHMASASR